jgi:hypothetical protein
MLNPSTADATQDDPTIRRCLGFAKRLGYDAIVVGNVYAYRATDPAALRTAADPFGPHNAVHLFCIAGDCDAIVCAWGGNLLDPGHGRRTAEILTRGGANLACLGTTKSGQPKHPLYLAANTPLVDWTPPA